MISQSFDIYLTNLGFIYLWELWREAMLMDSFDLCLHRQNSKYLKTNPFLDFISVIYLSMESWYLT